MMMLYLFAHGRKQKQLSLTALVGCMALSWGMPVLGAPFTVSTDLSEVTSGLGLLNSTVYSSGALLDGAVTLTLANDAGNAYPIGSSTVGGNSVSINTNNSGTGSVVFAGSRNVLGSLGNSVVSGSTVTTTYLNSVNAGANSSTVTLSNGAYVNTLSITGTGTLQGSGSFVGSLNYSGDGIVSLSTGASWGGSGSTIRASSSGTGTLTLAGTSGINTIASAVGQSATKLKQINAGATGGTSLFNGVIYANALAVTGNGTVQLTANTTAPLNFNSDGTLNLSSGGTTLTGAITASSSGSGTVILNHASGSSTVASAVGASGTSIKQITAGSDGGTSIFSGDIYANNIGVTGTGTLSFAGSAIALLNYSGDGVVNLTNAKSWSGAITTTVSNTGTLNLSDTTGTTTLTSLVGTAGTVLKQINAGATGATSQFNSDVFASNLSVTGTGTVSAAGNLSASLNYSGDGIVILAAGKTLGGAITTSNSGTGTLSLPGTSGVNTVTSTIGTAASVIKLINAGATGASSVFNANIFSTNLAITGSGTVTALGNVTAAVNYSGDGILSLASGKTLTGAVTASTSGNGTLTLLGSDAVTTTIASAVGTSSHPIKQVNAGIAGGLFTFNSDVFADTYTHTGTGSTSFLGNFTGTTVDFGTNDGSLNFADGSDLTAAVTATNVGTLNFSGSSVITGQVGSGTGAIVANINAGEADSTVTFSNAVYADNVSITDSGTVQFAANTTVMTGLVYSGDGVLELTTGGTTLSGAISTSESNSGTLVLSHTTGSSTIASAVGGSGALLKQINVGATGGTTVFQNDLYATNLAVTGSGTVSVLGNGNAALNYAGDGVLSLGSGRSWSGVITATSGIGTLILAGTSGTNTILSSVGSSAAKLKQVNAGATGGISVFSDAVYANALGVTGTGTVRLTTNTAVPVTFSGDGTLELTSGTSLTGAITTANGSGTLLLSHSSGTASIASVVGATGNRLKQVIAGNDSTSTVFSNSVFANTYTHTGTGITSFSGDFTGTTMAFGGNNGTINVGNNTSLTANVTASNVGTLNFIGNTTVSGTVGTSAAVVSAINAGASGRTVTFNNNVFTSTYTHTGTGTTAFGGHFSGTTLAFGANDGTVSFASGTNLSAAVTASTSGTLQFLGSSTISGLIGSANSGSSLGTILAGAAGNTVFNNNVYAQTLNVTGAGSVSLNGSANTVGIFYQNTAGTVVLADGANFTGVIDQTVSNTVAYGTLNLLGSSTVDAPVGSGSYLLSAVNAGVGASTFSSNIYATTYTHTGAAQTNFGGYFTGTSVVFGSNDGIISLAENQNLNLTGNVSSNANKGTLLLGGNNTITGHISSGTGLKQVTLSGDVTVSGGTGKKVQTKNLDLGAATLSIPGTSGHLVMNDSGTLSLTANSPTDYGNVQVSTGAIDIPTTTTIVVTIGTGGFIADGTRLVVANGVLGTGVEGGNTVTSTSDNLRFEVEGGSALTLVAIRQNPGTSGVSTAIAQSINSITTIGPDFSQVLASIDASATDNASVNAAYAQLAPAKTNNVQREITHNASEVSTHALIEHLDSVRTSGISAGDSLKRFVASEGAVWMRMFGGLGRQGNVDALGYKERIAGGIIGLDALATESFSLGGAFGYTHSVINIRGENSGESIGSYRVSVYGTKILSDHWYSDIVASTAFNRYDAHRAIVFTGVNRVADANYNGQQYMGRVALGKDTSKHGWQLMPRIALSYGQIWVDAYTEGNAGDLSLEIDSHMYDIVQSEVELKAAYPIKRSYTTWTPAFRVSWTHDYLSNVQATTAGFIGGGSSFVVEGAKSAKSGYNFGVSVVGAAKGNSHLMLEYNREYRARYKGQFFALTGRYQF